MSLTAMTLAAQQSGIVPGGATAASAVPNLVKYSGVLKDASDAVLTTLSGVTFLIYKDEQAGTPLWMETQNVQPDRTGHYTVQLGAVSKDGLPASTQTRIVGPVDVSSAELNRIRDDVGSLKKDVVAARGDLKWLRQKSRKSMQR